MSTNKVELPWGPIRNRRGLISDSVIHDLARRIVRRFQPEQIILFGSYARGHGKLESDLDVLVVMPARNEIDQSVRIEEFLDPPFSVDIIVRTPKNMRWRLQEGDWFLREVVDQGKILYEKTNQGVGAQSRRRSGRGAQNPHRRSTTAR